MISRDYGIFSIYISSGIVGFLLFFIFTALVITRLLKTKYSPEMKFSMIAWGVLFVSNLVFLHGSPMTTRPLDMLFLVSAAAICASGMKSRSEFPRPQKMLSSAVESRNHGYNHDKNILSHT